MDLMRSFHLIFPETHPIRRARKTVSMFFLQPTGFDPRSLPALMCGDDDGAATIKADVLRVFVFCVTAQRLSKLM